jgi:hypothetical protein
VPCLWENDQQDYTVEGAIKKDEGHDTQTFLTLRFENGGQGEGGAQAEGGK